jgi:hypothetical protein
MNYGYKIEHSSYTEITREADPDEQWDSDDLHTEWIIESKITESNDTFPDIVVPFKLDLDKTYYLVYVIYNTGDSFHHHSGYGCCFVEIFKDKDKAEDLSKKIKEQNKEYNSKRDLGKNAYSLSYKDELGNDKKISCEWNGYFESIQSCEVKEMHLHLTNKNKVKYKNKRA